MGAWAIVGGCAAPARLAPILAALAHETGCAYASIYRGQDAAWLLHRLGKQTQAEIYQSWREGREPNPANPPGRSTHELRSDAVAYPGPAGRRLRWWQCGVDVDERHADSFAHAARHHGWIVIAPYHTPAEYHHRNFARQPRLAMRFLPLREGSRGLWVWILTARLKNCGYLKARAGRYDMLVARAVKRFQHHHRLSADGTVDAHTWLNLKAAERGCERRHTPEV